MSLIPRFFTHLAAGVALMLAGALGAQQPTSNPSRSSGQSTNDPIARIRDEGLNRSQAMDLLTHLTDVIGPRLTGSPNLKRANEWTRDKLASWGLTNAHLHGWPFGRGWSLRRFSAQVVEPQNIPLVAWPQAWSCGSDWPVVADVVHLNAKTETELDQFKGRLKGAVVLVSSPRAVPQRYEPLASRLTDSDLLRLANATPGRRDTYTWMNRPTNAPPSANAPARSPRTDRSEASSQPPRTNEVRAVAATNQPSARPSRQIGTYERIPFAIREGAAVIVLCSAKGDAGTLMSQWATVFPPPTSGTNRSVGWGRSPWSTNAPAGPPEITLAAEDYNRLVHMIERGEKLKMAVDLQVQFHTEDLQSYNTLAEIPGTDLKDELVMLGGHLDSLHLGTGATDNAAGVAACMEAVRILQTLKLEPRRTVRIGLWGGEEQGYLGSRAYLNDHFGYYTNATNVAVAAARSPRDESRRPANRSSRSGSNRTLVRQAGYEKLSAYFNLDNGGGKIRGVYAQGNEGVRPIFRRWLEPFADLGAETLSAANTGGTDHVPFDSIGLPGFQFIQDPIDYMVRTHHTSADVADRIQADDLKQAAVIIAAFVYQTAMLEEKLPRKPTVTAPERPAQPRPAEPPPAAPPKPVARVAPRAMP
jgi:hypothetical protein